MRVLVDADACPVIYIIEKVSKANAINVILFADTSHILTSGYCETRVIEKGKDSVDTALINEMKKDDVVVTQDYGVAALALAKKGKAISQDGLIFDETNIDGLLLARHVNQQIRRGGGKMPNNKKRTKENDKAFERNFVNLLTQKED